MDTTSPGNTGADPDIREDASRGNEQAPKIAKEIERISSSIIRLTSSSIDGLRG
jgi:hypothetical protein